MGEAYRGLTIRFAADGKSVLSTLSAMRGAASRVEAELRMVKRGLRFDGSNTKLAQAQLKLMGEKAAAANASVRKMRTTLMEMGDVDIGGTKMKQLSASTRDASTQAALLKTRYNSVTESLATQYRELRKVAEGTKGLKRAAAAFKGKDFEGHNFEKMAAAIDQMGKKLGWSKEKCESLKASIKGMQAEFRAVSSEYKTMTDIAGFQSMTYKLEEEAAKQKAAVKELVASAKMLKFTGFEGGLESARAEMQRLEEQAKTLKTAMRLNPGDFTVAESHAETLRGKMKAIEDETNLLRREMSALSKTPGFSKLDKSSDALRVGMRGATEELERAATKMSELKGHATELRDKLLGIKSELNFDEALMASDDRIQAVNSELREMDVRIDEAAKTWRKAQENAQLYAKAVRYAENEARVASNTATVAAMNKRMATAKAQPLISSSAFTSMGMQMYSTLYPAAMMAGTHIIQSARDVDSAYRDMRKTVQGTEEEFETLRQKAIEFGDTHITAADDILEIESIGGQLGITVDNLEAFGKVVSDLSIATDEAFETEDIAIWLGKMSNIMHVSVDEYDNFADALVRLGNSEPALESDIAAITARFAGMATIVGSTPDEILAIATAATATGQKAEAAGGSLQRTFGRIEGAVAGVSDGMRNLEDMTDEDIEAFEGAVGKLQAYADVAGMTSESFAALWESDATSAFQKFVEGLKRINDEGGSVDKTLQDLGITGVRDRQLLEGLTNTTQVLAESLGMSKNAYNGISDAYGQAGDAAREAEKKSEGFSGTIGKIENTLQHLSVVAGDALLPVFNQVLGALGALTAGFDALSPSLKTAMLSTILLGAASGPMLTGIGATMNLVNSAKKSWAEYTSAENTLARVQGSMILSNTRTGKSFLESGEKVKKLQTQLVGLQGEQDTYSKYADKAAKNQAQYAKGTMEYERAAAARMAVEKKQAAVTARTARVERELAAAQASQVSAGKTLSKQSLGIGALKGLGTMAKGLGAMFAFSAAIAGIDMLGQHIVSVQEKTETFRKSTEGLEAIGNRIKSMASLAKEGFESQAASLSNAMYSYGSYTSKMEEAATAGAAMADTVSERVNDSFANAELAQAYSDKIMDLAGNCNGSAEKLTELKQAVEEYNSLTGSSIGITDDFTGSINASTAELEANTRAFQQNALAKAFAESYGDAMKQVANLNGQIKQSEMGAQQALESAGDYADIMQDLYVARQKVLNGEDSANQAQEAERLWNVLKDGGKEVLDAYAKYTDAMDAGLGLDKQLESAEAFAEGVRMAMVQQTNEAQKASHAQEEAARKAASASEYYKVLGESGKEAFESIREQAGLTEEQGDEVAKMLHDTGISLDLVKSVGGNAFAGFLDQANQVEGIDLATKLGYVEDAMRGVNNFGFDPKVIEITDQGATVEYEGKLLKLNEMTFADKKLTVTDDGSLAFEEGQSRELENSLARLNQTYHVHVETDTEQAMAKIEALKASLPKNMSTAVSVVQDNASSVMDNLKRTFGMNASQTVSVRTDTSAAEGELASFSQKAAEATKERILNVGADISSAVSKLTDLENTQLHSKQLDVYINVHGSIPTGGTYMGGVSKVPLHKIPRYASGAAMNGIVTRATMTNQGWVGEDGTEALMQMGRKTAVVPLSNRRYVRPFARAVAAEMGGQKQPVQSNVTNISINGISVNQESKMGALVSELADYAVQSRRS